MGRNERGLQIRLPPFQHPNLLTDRTQRSGKRIRGLSGGHKLLRFGVFDSFILARLCKRAVNPPWPARHIRMLRCSILIGGLRRRRYLTALGVLASVHGRKPESTLIRGFQQMAQTTANTIPLPSLRARFGSFFAGLGQSFNAYVERRSRIDQIQALDAKSDQELAELGLQRADIPRYVFRDLLYT